jgi:hypothetical protein
MIRLFIVLPQRFFPVPLRMRKRKNDSDVFVDEG